MREVLCIAYGQDGCRQRDKTLRRAEFASELGLQDVTLRGFLNGRPKTLGDGALRTLLAKNADIERLYEQHRMIEAPGEQVPTARPADSGRNRQETLGLVLAIEFEGFTFPDQPVTFRLPPGREGVVTLKVKVG